ncbi:MAG: oligosaccharide repeat unit polymerase [Modestobacter sp.]|nr:oligosaccharide repeat unit polymerase [Modestobacter sp.]
MLEPTLRPFGAPHRESVGFSDETTGGPDGVQPALAPDGPIEGAEPGSGADTVRLSVLLFGLAALAFSIVVPTWIVRVTPGPHSSAWPGALAIVVLVGLRYAWLVGSGRPRLVEMIFWLFTYVFMGLAPLVQLRTGVDPGTTPYLSRQLAGTALLVVGVGCAAFLVAATLAGRSSSRRASDRPAGSPAAVQLLSLGSLLVTAYFLVHIKGALFQSRDALAAAALAAWPNATTAALIAAGGTMPLLVAFVASTLLRAQGQLRDRASTVLYAVVTVTLLATVNPISSARYLFGTVFLAVLASIGMYRTATRFRVVAVAAVAALVLVFPYADAFRHSSSATINDTGGVVGALQNGDYDAFGQIDNTVLYTTRYGITDGRQALGVAFFWVPRALWADKPVDTGVLLAEFRNYTFKNLSAPLWAELFINGGWPLLVIGMGVFGWFARRSDNTTTRLLKRQRAPSLLGCILPFYGIIVLRGSLLQATANLAAILVAAAFVAWFAAGKTTDDTPVIAAAHT